MENKDIQELKELIFQLIDQLKTLNRSAKVLLNSGESINAEVKVSK